MKQLSRNRSFVIFALFLGLSLLCAQTVMAAPVFEGVVTASHTSGNGASSFDIGVPPSANSGDLLIAVVSVHVGFNQEITPATGWNLINEGNSAGNFLTVVRLGVWYRIVGSGTQPTSYTFGYNAQRAAGAILCYRCADLVDPIDASGDAIGYINHPLAPSVTTTLADTTILRFYGSKGKFSGYPTGYINGFNQSSEGGVFSM